MSSSDKRDAWETFGEGAFSGDSPVYLVLAGFALAFVVANVVFALGKATPRMVRVVGLFGAGSIAVPSIVALGLILYYWGTGVPFRNFQPMGNDDLLYGLNCLIPLVAIGGVILVAWKYRRVLKG